MNELTDQRLLSDYAERGSEAAFTELVRRRIDFVYSAALRMVRDPQLAEDVTQGVFVALAREARPLRRTPALAGWLHRTTRNIAAKTVRSDVRRRIREQEAAAMNELFAHEPEAGWDHIAPHLDEALSELSEPERDVLFLRYFENKSLREVGQALGTSDDAAQKRVSRAIDRLREYFARRGVSVSAGGLAVVVSANAVQSAPAGLALTVSTGALAAPAGVGVLTFSKIMTVTKLKLGVVSVVILAGTLMVLWLQRAGRNSAARNGSGGSAAARSATGAAGSTVSRGLLARNRLRSEPAATPAAAAAEEIVSERVSRFGRSRRDIVREIGRRAGKPVPSEVEAFFDSIEGGDWTEINARWKALAAKSGQYDKPGEPSAHSAELDPFWPAVLDAYGPVEAAHLWPAQRLLEYGENILGSLRPGMVYLGGTDPGRFIPTLLTETAEGERHIVLTQVAFADLRYLDYTRFLYGDRMNMLTEEDSKRAFRDYLADYQKRLTHDQNFPHEPKQVRPGENVTGVEAGEGATIVSDNVRVSGQAPVTAVNERLLKILLEKNPGRSFAMEANFPMPGLYADATPLGPLLELRVEDKDNALSPERAAQSVDYWRRTAQTMLAEAGGGPTRGSGHFAYAKMAMEQAEMLMSRGYKSEAEQTFRLANEIGPSPESFHRLINLLWSEGRQDDAIAAAEDTLRRLPSDDQLREVFGDRGGYGVQLRQTTDEMKRLRAQGRR